MSYCPSMSRLRSVPVLVALVVTLGQPRAPRAGDADPWFGPDKTLHFEAAGSLAIVGYAGAAMATPERPWRAAAGAALGIGAGIGKELWDREGHGDASWRDLSWDVIGAVTGVLVALAVDWTVHRIFDWPVGRRAR
jgi:putative lipoprotein